MVDVSDATARSLRYMCAVKDIGTYRALAPLEASSSIWPRQASSRAHVNCTALHCTVSHGRDSGRSTLRPALTLIYPRSCPRIIEKFQVQRSSDSGCLPIITTYWVGTVTLIITNHHC